MNFKNLKIVKYRSLNLGYTFYYATTNFIGIKTVINTLDEK